MGFLTKVIRGSYSSAMKEYNRSKKDIKKVKKFYKKTVNKTLTSEQVSKALTKEYPKQFKKKSESIYSGGWI